MKKVGDRYLKKSIKRNYIYNLLYQIFTIITPFITAPYLARVLGADGVGTVSYIEAVASYFVLLASLGISTFGQREISYVQDDREKRTVLFWETICIEFCTSVVAMVLYIIFSIKQSDSKLYLALIFNILAVAMDTNWLFQGMEEFGKIVLRNFIIKIIYIIYIFIVVKSRDDLFWYLFGASFFGILSNLSLWYYLPGYVDKPNWKKLRPFRHMGMIISLFIPTIATQVYTIFDKTMIGVITKDAYENGYYEQAVRISKMALMVITSLGTVMIPRIGFHYEKGDTDIIKKLMYRGYRFAWFLGVPLCFGLIMISRNFVGWFFGEGYEGVVPLLRILSFLILAIGINYETGSQYLIPTKRQNIYTITVVIGAVTNFVMNLLLIQRFQAIGAAIASVAAETIIAIVQIIIVRNELNPLEILKSGIHYYVAGGIMAFALYFIEKSMAVSIWNTLFMVLVGSIIYGLALLLMRDEFLINLIKQEITKLRDKKIRR